MDLQSVLNQWGPEFEKRAPELDQENKFAEENFLKLQEAGVYKALIPADLGGGGVSYSDLCVFLKDLAKFCPSTALTLSMHQHLVAVLTLKHLKGDGPSTNTLKAVVANDLILVSTGGGDWVSSNGSAEKVDGGYRITCRKAFCSGAPLGNVAVMSCAYDDGESEHVLHFSTPLNAEGVEILNDWDAMGMRGTGSHSIDFKNVFIPKEKVGLIRERGKWHPVWDVVCTLAFPIFMSPYAGVVEAIHDKTVDLFSKRAKKDPVSTACIGKMNNHYQITKWAIEDMVRRVNNFDISPDTTSASKAIQGKSIVSSHGRQSAQCAMEALGGYSYFRKVGLERLYRDLLAGEFHPLQSHKQEFAIGNFLMGGPFVE